MSDQINNTNDYLSCAHYLSNTSDEQGIHRFEEQGRYYFSFIENGKVILRSEAYANESGRETGVVSVLKNMVSDENYKKTNLPDGRWGYSLLAGNNQEIARTCPVENEIEADSYLPSARAAAKLSMLQNQDSVVDNVSFRQDDDYLICREYEEKISSVSEKYPDFISFQHENTEKYYFAWINKKSEIILRSEGYSTASARDNGIESVIKNREISDRFKIEEKHGAFFLILKAGNHQEIGRSCPRNSEEELWTLIQPESKESKSETVADDYMICREYEEKIASVSAKHSDFITFQHENTGKHYFAWINKKGEIILRSEGYPTTAARDNGMESVIKNREIHERFKIEESHGAYFLVLKAGNHQEIGRSCPNNSEEALWALIKPEEVKAEKISSDRTDDDYLLCKEYESRQKDVSSTYDDFITFHDEKMGMYYFAWVSNSGEIILRSEGYATAASRDNGIESVRKNRDNRDRFEVEEKHGKYFLVLKAGNHQEIGRSCPHDSEAALWALLAPVGLGAVALAAPITVAAVASASNVAAVLPTEVKSEMPPIAAKITSPPVASMAPVSDSKSGFNWWWLLPLLLLLGLLLWWKGCNKEAEVSTTLPSTESQSVTTPTIDDSNTNLSSDAATQEAPPAAPSCDLNWIFFDYDKYELKNSSKAELAKMSDILKGNPEYVAVLRAFTDAKGSDEYNLKLSQNRADAAKNYLSTIGVAADRITAEAASKSAPVASNTEDDSGRKFNRRVELYIRDKAGKDICKSIQPNIPSGLKTN